MESALFSDRYGDVLIQDQRLRLCSAQVLSVMGDGALLQTGLQVTRRAEGSVSGVSQFVEHDLTKATLAIERLSERIPARQRVRRIIDLAFFALAAGPFAILFAAIGLAIFANDRGPILYRQTRLGKDGVPFQLYKFRSMVVNADKLQSSLERFNECRGSFKMHKDPRVTRVGRFLRETSLDELPQLLNLARGDMTLVGPRACSVPIEMYSPHQKGRLAVKPGIVGPAQIWLRDGHFDEKTELELLYLKRRCAKLDLYIFAATLGAIVKRTGV